MKNINDGKGIQYQKGRGRPKILSDTDRRRLDQMVRREKN